MAEEVTPKERERAGRATQLLDNPLLVECWDAMEARIIDAWRVSDGPERREALWHQLKNLEDLRAALRRVADNPKVKDAWQTKRQRRQSNSG